ncbi:MAG TPA: HD domain-containing phosphohydrolase [Limnochordia bacterium]|jgi:putative nucleotidyltransferase with HDIG domain|nr:HD domain-containing protein [Bacillota bacterium]HKM43543.1 HD domain-containing phosphohydrolase [Limnochordia bacterium]
MELIVMLDQATYNHSVRVQKLALALGSSLGLDKSQLASLSTGALLHDLGKHKIPADILFKPEGLTRDEREVMENHPVFGWEITKHFDLEPAIAEIVLHHHLWYNGQGGYPHINSEDRPSLLAQITTVADVIDAMTEDRPYRKGLSIQTSFDFLLEGSGSRFNPALVDCALHTLDHMPFVAS